MKKVAILLLFSCATVLLLEAQTIGQFTMWNQNHYIVNPAAAGNLDYFDVALGYRRQWTGIKEAPATFYATGHTVLNRTKRVNTSAIRSGSSEKELSKISKKKVKLKHAAGGMISSNEFGAFTKNEISLTYALHLPITKKISLSFGLTAGVNTFGFDESRASVIQDNDPIFNAYASGGNTNELNINTGTYLYSDRFFVGYSAFQILENEIELSDVKVNSAASNISLHHLIIAGYHYDISNDFRITPSVILKQVANNPLSVDINTTFTYKGAMYIGLGYRTTDAISIMTGYQFNHLLRAGYAYDYTTSEIRNVGTGSHELFIGLTLF